MLHVLDPVEIKDGEDDREFNEFWEWYESGGRLRSRELLVLGYIALKSREDEWKRRYDALLKEKNKMREVLQYEMELATRERVEREVAKETARIDAMSAVRNKEIEVEMMTYKGMYEAARKELHEVLSGALTHSRDKEIADLAASLKRAEEELGILRRSNYGKGVVGETIIRDFLRREWPTACIVDMAQTKHSCDLHMILDDREVWAFESKYKDTIVKSDIDKFYNDVIHMSIDPKFHGAVFISLKTANIPGKGDMCLEMVNGKVPVLFVGGTGEDWLMECTWFRHCMNMLMQVARQSKRVNNENMSVEALVEKLKPIMERIKKLRANINKMRNNVLASAISLTADMEADVRGLFEVVGEIMGGECGATPLPAGSFKCEKCARTFVNKQGLASHMRCCK
jgi:hypothetical protein